jgi:hypothetical protein
VPHIEDKDGGIGQGVWSYGLEAGISKNLGTVEPYLLTSYLFGGTRTRDGVHEDRADVFSLLVGAQWTLSPVATLDTRVQFNRSGTDKKEARGSQVTEESYFTVSPAVSLYVHLTSRLTFIAGGGISFVENHVVNDVLRLGVENDHALFFQIGLHVLIGGE